MKYDAFISYRQLKPDKTIAIELQKLLEKYRPPKDITSDRKLIGRIFRDSTELPASSDLGEEIRTALSESEYLIVVCSPRTKLSEWCMQEIEYFKDFHDGNTANIILLLIEGEPDNVFPESVKTTRKRVTNLEGEKFVEIEVEPLSADIRDKNVKRSIKLLRTEVLRIIAAMYNCGYDQLYRRHLKQKRRKTRVVTISVIISLVILLIYSWIMFSNIRDRQNQILSNESVRLSHYAFERLKEGDINTSLLLALEALPENIKKPERPIVDIAVAALRSAVLTDEYLDRNNVRRQVLSVDFDIDDSVYGYCSVSNMSDDGTIIEVTDGNQLFVYDVGTGEELMRIPVSQRFSYCTGNLEYYFTMITSHRPLLYNWDLNFYDIDNGISSKITIRGSEQPLHVTVDEEGELIYIYSETYCGDEAHYKIIDCYDYRGVQVQLNNEVNYNIYYKRFNAVLNNRYNKLLVSPTGHYMVTELYDEQEGKMRKYLEDTSSGDVLHEFDQTVSYMFFSEDGEYLVFVSNKTLKILDLISYKQREFLFFGDVPKSQIKSCSDGSIVFASGSNVYSYDMEDNDCQLILESINGKNIKSFILDESDMIISYQCVDGKLTYLHGNIYKELNYIEADLLTNVYEVESDNILIYEFFKNSDENFFKSENEYHCKFTEKDSGEAFYECEGKYSENLERVVEFVNDDTNVNIFLHNIDGFYSNNLKTADDESSDLESIEKEDWETTEFEYYSEEDYVIVFNRITGDVLHRIKDDHYNAYAMTEVQGIFYCLHRDLEENDVWVTVHYLDGSGKTDILEYAFDTEELLPLNIAFFGICDSYLIIVCDDEFVVYSIPEHNKIINVDYGSDFSLPEENFLVSEDGYLLICTQDGIQIYRTDDNSMVFDSGMTGTFNMIYSETSGYFVFIPENMRITHEETMIKIYRNNNGRFDFVGDIFPGEVVDDICFFNKGEFISIDTVANQTYIYNIEKDLYEVVIEGIELDVLNDKLVEINDNVVVAEYNWYSLEDLILMSKEIISLGGEIRELSEYEIDEYYISE